MYILLRIRDLCLTDGPNRQKALMCRLSIIRNLPLYLSEPLVYMFKQITSVSIFRCRIVKVLVSIKRLLSSPMPRRCYLTKQYVHVYNVLRRIATFLD